MYSPTACLKRLSLKKDMAKNRKANPDNVARGPLRGPFPGKHTTIASDFYTSVTVIINNYYLLDILKEGTMMNIVRKIYIHQGAGNTSKQTEINYQKIELFSEIEKDAKN